MAGIGRGVMLAAMGLTGAMAEAAPPAAPGFPPLADLDPASAALAAAALVGALKLTRLATRRG